MCVYVCVYIYIYIYTYRHLTTTVVSLPQAQALGRVFITPVRRAIEFGLQYSTVDDERACLRRPLRRQEANILLQPILLHPVSITRFPLRRFSPGAGLLRNRFFHR